MGKEWTKPMQWDNEGTPPSESLVKSGFQAYYKPPANIFNYFLHRIKACIEELQTEADAINDVKATKEELSSTASTLQTSIDGKAAKSDLEEVSTGLQAVIDGKAPTYHATTAPQKYGMASSTLYGHARASSTTPKAHGTAAIGSETGSFARGDHVHPMQEAGVGITTEGDGSEYTAVVEGITELAVGANFVMIPHVVSATTTPKLNVNGLGAKTIRRRLSGSTTATTYGGSASWLTANKPVRMTYDGTYWIADVTKPNAADLYGTLPITSGGTGASSAATALTNLGAFSKPVKLWENGNKDGNFNAQTLSLTTTKDYDFIVIVYKSCGNNIASSGLIPTRSYDDMGNTPRNVITGIYLDSTKYYDAYRTVAINDDGSITIGGGRVLKADRTEMTESYLYALVPLIIYGLR